MNNISVSAASVEVEASSPNSKYGSSSCDDRLVLRFVLAAVGGSASLQWSVSDGSLPAGINRMLPLVV